MQTSVLTVSLISKSPWRDFVCYFETVTIESAIKTTLWVDKKWYLYHWHYLLGT